MNLLLARLRLGLLTAAAWLTLSSTATANAIMDRLSASTSRPGLECTQDGLWCVSNGGTHMSVLSRTADGKLAERARLPLENDEDLRIESSPWQTIVRSRQNGRPEQVLVGIKRRQSESYSGGGGSLTELQLFSIGASRNAATAGVSAPLESSFMIRACFTPEDEKSRRGACHDEYHFAGELNLAKSRRSGEVSLLFKGRAETYPGRRNRMDDSSMEPPLRKSDLVWALDADCTFQRYIRWSPSTGALTWSRPLPSCESFLQLQ